eukprot:1838519-Rhodomonas_salina.1
MKSLLSPVSVSVLDRHADPEVSMMGSVDFRPIDIMTRAGWPRDADYFAASAWFVLQDWAGMPVAGNLNLAFDLEGCQNAYSPEFKQIENVVKLEDIADEHLAGTDSNPDTHTAFPWTQKHSRHILPCSVPC